MSSFLQDTGDHSIDSIDRPMAVEKTILIWYNNSAHNGTL